MVEGASGKGMKQQPVGGWELACQEMRGSLLTLGQASQRY